MHRLGETRHILNFDILIFDLHFSIKLLLDRSSLHNNIFLSFCSFSYSGACSDLLELPIHDVINVHKKFQWR